VLSFDACSSCRRNVDQLQEPFSRQLHRFDFFQGVNRSDAVVRKLADEILRRDQGTQIINPIIRNHGLPRWSKAQVIIGNPNDSSSNRGTHRETSVEDTFVVVPLVMPDESHVNAFLLASIDDSVSFRIYDGEQYKSFGYRSENPTMAVAAEDVASAIMFLDQITFGYTEFKIKDTNLFSRGSDMNFTSARVFVQPCGEWVLIVYNVFTGQFQVETYSYPPCPTVSNDDNSASVWSPFWEFAGVGSGSGSGGSGGSGGGGGGFIDGGGGGPRDLGWEPWPQESNEQRLRRMAQSINDVAIELETHSSNNNWYEYCATIFENNGRFFPRNVKTDNDDQWSKPNLLSNVQGDIYAGVIHFHGDAVSGNRSAPSGADVWFLRFKRRQFVLFVECGNVRYALIVNDQNNCNAFTLNHSSQELNQLIYNRANTLFGAGGISWQKATEIALMEAIGSMSASGIGFYISTNADKTEFELLNP